MAWAPSAGFRGVLVGLAVCGLLSAGALRAMRAAASGRPEISLQADKSAYRAGDKVILRIRLEANSRLRVCDDFVRSLDLVVSGVGAPRALASLRFGDSALGSGLGTCGESAKRLGAGDRLSRDLEGRLVATSKRGAVLLDFGAYGLVELPKAGVYELRLNFNPSVEDPDEFYRLEAFSNPCRLKLR